MQEFQTRSVLMNYKIYQTTVLMIVMMVCISVVSVPTVEASNKWSFMSKIVQKDKKMLSGITRNFKQGGVIKKLPDAGALSRKLNIPQRMLTSPAVRKMALAGEEVISHGTFAEKMLNKSNMPELVIKQYSHYGKQDYLKVAESVSKIMTKSKSGISSSLLKLKDKYKGMNDVINKFNTGGYDKNNDVFVRIINRTGKRGMQVLGWLAKHPKLAATGAVTAWYLSDPEGFEDALATSGKKLGAFVSESTINVTAGVSEGINSGFIRSLGIHSINSAIMGGLAIILALLLALSKTFRRILFFPFTLLGKKANEKMDKMEEKPSSRGHRSTTKSNQNQSNKRTPRNNL